jgi:hypothetical protein
MKLGGVEFDDKLPSGRRNVVSSLFDHVITFRHAELRAARGAIHAAAAGPSMRRSLSSQKPVGSRARWRWTPRARRTARSTVPSAASSR